jgi:hypothetical protein
MTILRLICNHLLSKRSNLVNSTLNKQSKKQFLKNLQKDQKIQILIIRKLRVE